MSTWRPDVLGPGFESLDLALGEDDEGPLSATLVRHLPPPRSWWRRIFTRKPLLHDVDVLYVHGWSDYFFQKRLARFWSDRGANFYALDLRKYGRSLREGQTPGYIDDLAQYDEDIERALQVIRPEQERQRRAASASQPGPVEQGGDRASADGATILAAQTVDQQHDTDMDDTAAHDTEAHHTGSLAPPASLTGSAVSPEPQASERPLVLFGHSTGGLVLSLWAARNPGAADALVLNSPWLEFQLARMGRQILAPLLDLRARLHAKDASSGLDLGFYARAQHEVRVEEDLAEVNHEWRPERSHPVSVGWLRAILKGHHLVEEGLGIDAPICVLLSAHSAAPVKWNEELTRSDTVLDVHEVARAALKLGSSVTVEWFEGALHDIFLSRREVRDEAYARLDRWVRGWAASRRAR